MKGTTTPLLAALLLASGCSYHRLGSLTQVSTRNLDPTANYVELQRGAEAKVVTRHDDLLQEAVDQCVRQHPGGEYMRNVVIYMNGTGRRVKVQGDIWGRGTALDVSVPVQPKMVGQQESIALKAGDRVAWQGTGKVLNGVVVGLRTTTAMVEYDSGGEKKLREVDLDKLTRLE